MSRTLFTLLICAAALAPAHPLGALEFGAEDFLLPVAVAAEEKEEARAVRAPEKVEEKEVWGQPAVVALDARDAINTVANRRAAGCELVKFGSGFGFVAVGEGAYGEHANPTATRIAKRNAYLVAYQQAKAELMKTLGGLSIEAREEIRASLETLSDATADHVNLEESSEESLTQATSMLLRGFVVYDVVDDAANNRVCVSIVTTPKLRRELNRPTPSTLEASDYEEALQATLAEIRAGVVPPVGTRVIKIRGTGSLCFVGFGSSVIRHHDRAAVQSRLRINAEKAAGMRAQDALLALLTGERDTWRASLDEETRSNLEEFEANHLDDEAGVERFDAAKESFLNRFHQSDVYESVRAGTLPTGVEKRTWVSDDGGTAYAVAIYAPGVKAVADRGDGDAEGPEAGGEGEVERGPTGQVTDPDDLAVPDWAKNLERDAGHLYGLGKASGKGAKQRALASAYLEIAQQLMVSVEGRTEIEEETETETTDEGDSVHIKERFLEAVATTTERTLLVGARTHKMEMKGDTVWALVRLEKSGFNDAVEGRVAEIDRQLARLEEAPERIDVDYIRQVRRILPLVHEREGFALIIRGQGGELPASPLPFAEVEARVGLLAHGARVMLEGAKKAPSARDAVLDVIDDLGVTVHQDESAPIELRLRERKRVTEVGGWHKLRLTGAVTVVDRTTGEIVGSLETTVKESSTEGEAVALDRARETMIRELGDKVRARLLPLMTGRPVADGE